MSGGAMRGMVEALGAIRPLPAGAVRSAGHALASATIAAHPGAREAIARGDFDDPAVVPVRAELAELLRMVGIAGDPAAYLRAVCGQCGAQLPVSHLSRPQCGQCRRRTL